MVEAYVADIIGIAFGLEELRHIRRQRVLLEDLFQTFLVEGLQHDRTIRTDVTCVAFQHRESLPAELRTSVTADSHRSSEAG